MPRTTPFYISTYFAMKRGFEACGVDVGGGTELLDNDSMNEFCRQFNPDVVMEMNRSRNHIPSLPKKIIHIAWIVDLASYDVNDFRRSEILYFFAHYWLQYYKKKPTGILDWLPPGFCPQTYSPKKSKNFSDFSFMGHIPLPWKIDELSRVVYTDDDGSQCSFEEFNALLNHHWQKAHEAISLRKILIKELGSKRKAKKIFYKTIEHPTVKYDLGCRSGRLFNRKRLLNHALNVSDSIRIYGPPTWTEWPEYKAYYKKFIYDPRKIASVYRSSKLNLHEGVIEHMRTFDCLGTGAGLIYLKAGTNNCKKSKSKIFEPDVHFLFTDEYNFSEKALSFLTDKRRRKKMTQKAAAFCHAHHTWADRAQKILSDINKVRN